MNIIDKLIEKAQADPQKIVFPESTEPKILLAAKKVLQTGVAKPILVGVVDEIKRSAELAGVDISEMTIVNPDNDVFSDGYVERYEREGCIFSGKKLKKMLKKELNLAAAMVRFGDADGMVAGLTHTTAEVILASHSLIGLQKDISTPSSLFLMNIPGFNGSEGNLIVLSDGGVCESPTVSELADIAITTSETVVGLLGWEPRIALLSYSTKGSVQGEKPQFMLDVLNKIKSKKPDLKVDGELQLDAAIIPEVAEKKTPSQLEVAGKANILIVPDLNVGNILYKAIQRFAKAEAYGPFLQGFAKTVSDLSRGSSVNDIYGVVVMASVRAQSLKM